MNSSEKTLELMNRGCCGLVPPSAYIRIRKDVFIYYRQLEYADFKRFRNK